MNSISKQIDRASFRSVPRFLSMAIGAATMAVLVASLVSVPRAEGQSNAAAVPSFEVASIKPNSSGDNRVGIQLAPGRFTAEGATLKMIIEIAYNIKSDAQLSGGPGWVNSDRYNFDAKIDDATAEELGKLPPDQRGDKIRLMIQGLLAERFQLKLSHETKDLPIYALVVAKNGPKLTHSPDPPPNPDGTPNGGGRGGPGGRGGQGIRIGGRGDLEVTGSPIGSLATVLSGQLGRTVVDETGLKGNYDFKLQWTPDSQVLSNNPAPDAAPPPDTSGPSIFTALQEQLGLKLESRKGPTVTYVIDHVEKPSEN